MRVLCVAFVLSVALPASASESLICFPAAKPQIDYPRGLRASPRYRVLAKLATDATPWSAENHQTAAYEAWPDYLDPQSVPLVYRDVAVHFAQVDADGRTRFRVEIQGGEIDTLNVVPSRYAEVRESLRHGEKHLIF